MRRLRSEVLQVGRCTSAYASRPVDRYESKFRVKSMEEYATDQARTTGPKGRDNPTHPFTVGPPLLPNSTLQPIQPVVSQSIVSEFSISPFLRNWGVAIGERCTIGTISSYPLGRGENRPSQLFYTPREVGDHYIRNVQVGENENWLLRFPDKNVYTKKRFRPKVIKNVVNQ